MLFITLEGKSEAIPLGLHLIILYCPPFQRVLCSLGGGWWMMDAGWCGTFLDFNFLLYFGKFDCFPLIFKFQVGWLFSFSLYTILSQRVIMRCKFKFTLICQNKFTIFLLNNIEIYFKIQERYAFYNAGDFV